MQILLLNIKQTTLLCAYFEGTKPFNLKHQQDLISTRNILIRNVESNGEHEMSSIQFVSGTKIFDQRTYLHKFYRLCLMRDNKRSLTLIFKYIEIPK